MVESPRNYYKEQSTCQSYFARRATLYKEHSESASFEFLYCNRTKMRAVAQVESNTYEVEKYSRFCSKNKTVVVV